MQHIIEALKMWATDPMLVAVVRVAILLFIVLPLVYMLARFTRKAIERKYSQQAGMLVSKGIVYVGFIIVSVAVLNELGFQLGALLGAAGIAAVAIGFASQTSLSNIISGLFLISEKPFSVGDLIRIGDEVGFVMSIDLLSIKIRGRDNRFIRIPNEHIIKAQLINLTRFPIRRIDLDIGVAYKEDPHRVIAVLKDIARCDPLCLDEPEPHVQFKAFGESELAFLFGVWSLRTDYVKLRTSILSTIKTRFDKEGIEIPFPHRSLYTGSVTDPMPIRIVPDGLFPETSPQEVTDERTT